MSTLVMPLEHNRGGCRYTGIKILYRCSGTRKGRCNVVIVGTRYEQNVNKMYRARIRWHEAGRIGFRDQCSRHSGSVSKPCLLYVVLVIDSYSGGMGSSWKSCKIDRIVRVKWKKTFFFLKKVQKKVKLRFEFMI